MGLMIFLGPTNFYLHKLDRKIGEKRDFFWSNEIDFFNIMFRLSERGERKWEFSFV